MTKLLVFRVKTVGLSTREGRSPQSLLKAAKHNLRMHSTVAGTSKTYDPARSHLNIILCGPKSADELVENAEVLKKKYGLNQKRRVDHVQAIEIVISTPPNFGFDPMDFFKDSLVWIAGKFCEEMVLSAVVHHDQARPHMHVLVMPIRDGKYTGGKPISRPNLHCLKLCFVEDVSRHYGLLLLPKLNHQQRDVACNIVTAHLNSRADPVLGSSIWEIVHNCIHRSPGEFLEYLDLEMPEQRDARPLNKRTMAQIFTSTGRKTIEDRLHQR